MHGGNCLIWRKMAEKRTAKSAVFQEKSVTLRYEKYDEK